MKHKTLWIGALVCLLPMLLGLALYSQLPEQIPSHWNAAGEIDSYFPKPLMIFGMPLFFMGIHLVCQLGIRNDPKKEGQSKALQTIVLWIVPIIALFVVPVSIFTAMGASIPVTLFITVLVGILFILLGNYMPKSRVNYTMGIRLPWTLNSEENWRRTHRLAGYLFIICGFLFIVCGLLGFYWGLIVTLPMVLVLMVYSFYLYKKGV